MACSSCSRFLHAVFFALNIFSIFVYILIVTAISVLSRSFLKSQWKKIRIKIKSQWTELLTPVLVGNSHPLLQRTAVGWPGFALAAKLTTPREVTTWTTWSDNLLVNDTRAQKIALVLQSGTKHCSSGFRTSHGTNVRLILRLTCNLSYFSSPTLP